MTHTTASLRTKFWLAALGQLGFHYILSIYWVYAGFWPLAFQLVANCLFYLIWVKGWGRKSGLARLMERAYCKTVCLIMIWRWMGLAAIVNLAICMATNLFHAPMWHSRTAVIIQLAVNFMVFRLWRKGYWDNSGKNRDIAGLGAILLLVMMAYTVLQVIVGYFFG